ncbi:hypothetical protein HanRHA438_Chr05g0203931 [Helianthus annuus]|nr:hypothetical protein HanRHA438_Chr05g0203931 [Helianthus annuus]
MRRFRGNGGAFVHGWPGGFPSLASVVWCNVPPLFFFEFKDILDINKFIKIGKKAKMVTCGLAIIACWCI